MRGVAVLTDEFDQFRVEHYMLVDPDGPRTCKGFGIIDGDIDFKASIVRPAEPLDRFSGVG